MEKEIKDLFKFKRAYYKNREDFFDFGLKEIEYHVPELQELDKKKDEHLYAEIADVYIWSSMLLLNDKVGKEIVLARVKKFKAKTLEYGK